MALNGLLLLELVLYVSCFICGIVTAASLTIIQGKFASRCVLYGLVSYNETSDSIGILYSSSPSLCYFVSAISVMVAVACFSFSLYCLYTVYIEGHIKRERIWVNFTAAVCTVFLFFLIITGCVLRMGFKTLCNSIAQAVPNITSCDEAQFKAWAAPLNGDHFYSSLHKAETAVWGNVFLWLMIGTLIFVQRNYNLNNKNIPGGFGLTAGRLLADPGVTAAETEPFFNSPARPQ